jgi:AraC family transcriptional regulator
MKPRFETKAAFCAIGIASFYKISETGKIPELWDEFAAREDEPSDRVGNHWFGICDMPEDIPEDFDFRYVASVEVSGSCSVIPEGMVKCSLPAHDYAVFTHKGPITEIGKTFDYIHEEWLPESEYVPCGEFEFYGDNFNCEDPMDKNSEVDLYIAISKKS